MRQFATLAERINKQLSLHPPHRKIAVIMRLPSPERPIMTASS
jgi:hypothetical protein